MLNAADSHGIAAALFRALLVMIIAVTSCRSRSWNMLTKPEILHGGWKPILPGDPFYFGPIRPKSNLQHLSTDISHRKNAEQDFKHVKISLTRLPKIILPERQVHVKHEKDIFAFYPPPNNPDILPDKHKYKPVYIEHPRKPLEIFEHPNKQLSLTVQSLKEVYANHAPNLPIVHSNDYQNKYAKDSVKAAEYYNILPVQALPVVKGRRHNTPYVLLSESPYKAHSSAAAKETSNAHYSRNNNLYLSQILPQYQNAIAVVNSAEIPKVLKGHVELKPNQGVAYLSHTLVQQSPESKIVYLNDIDSQKLSSLEDLLSSQPIVDPLHWKQESISNYAQVAEHQTGESKDQQNYDIKVPVHFASSESVEHNKHSLISRHPPAADFQLNKGSVISEVDYKNGKNVGEYDRSLLKSSNGRIPDSLHNTGERFVTDRFQVPVSKHLNKMIMQHTSGRKNFGKPREIFHSDKSTLNVPSEEDLRHLLPSSSDVKQSENVREISSFIPLEQPRDQGNSKSFNNSYSFVSENNLPRSKNESTENESDNHKTNLNLEILLNDKIASEQPRDEERDDPEVIYINENGETDSRGIKNPKSDNPAENVQDDFTAEQVKEQETAAHDVGIGTELFHAYYAPADHSPPEGYVRLTVEEFNEMFKNAELRFMENESQNVLNVTLNE